MILTSQARSELTGYTQREIVHGAAPWLTSLLAICDSSRAIERWRDAGRPMGPHTVAFAGYRGLAAVVDRVVASVPPPVAWHAAQHCLIVGGGLDVSGFVAAMPALPPAPRYLIVIQDLTGDDENAQSAVIAHEMAHAFEWQPDASRPKTGAGRCTLSHHCAFRDDDNLTRAIRTERRAAELAHEWGFRGDAANAAHAITVVKNLWDRRRWLCGCGPHEH